MPALVITEVCYLLETRLGSVAERLGDLEVATTDCGHFHAVQEARVFTLYPTV